MATKTKKKFKKITFGIDEFPYCCGIGVPCGFREDEGGYSWEKGKYVSARNIYETEEEQAEALYKEMIEHNEQVSQYSYLTIALVSNYKNKGAEDQGQLPKFQDILIREDWTINQVFINPNHGNELTVFSKYFPEIRYADENDDDDDDF